MVSRPKLLLVRLTICIIHLLGGSAPCKNDQMINKRGFSRYRPIRCLLTKFTELLVLVLVLVDDEPVSFSAVRAHIFPGLVKSVLEHVHCRSIYNMLRQTVPDVDHSVGEE